jgi:dynein heavy chain
VSDNDKEWFNAELLRLVENHLGKEMLTVAKDTRCFVDFMRDAPEPTGEDDGEGEPELPKFYEAAPNLKVLSERLHFFLEQYNEIMRGSSMDLVFFEDAIGHLVKIARAIRNPGGNIMLVRPGLISRINPDSGWSGRVWKAESHQTRLLHLLLQNVPDFCNPILQLD